MNLQEQLQEVTENLSQLDPNNRDHLVDIARLEQQKAVLTMQLEDSKAQEAEQQRIQVQEEKVASIKLPIDCNELFDDSNADDIIIELIQQFQRQAHTEHNEELNEMATAHREELRAATDRVSLWKQRYDELKAKNDELLLENDRRTKEAREDEATIEQLRSQVEQIELERKDIESKRDAAVREKEGIELLLTEKQAQIDKLRDEIAIGAVAAVNVVNIDPSERLARLVEESKNAKIKSAIDIALENTTPFRGKVSAVAELNTPEVTPFQPIDQASDTGYQLVTGPVTSVSAEDQVTFPEQATEVPSLSTPVAQGDASETGKTLEERVAALEAKVFGA